MNLEEIYSRLSTADRSNLAHMFLANKVGQNQNVDPNNVTPAQLASMHQEAQQHNPGLLGQIRNHPAMAGILGGIATYEVDKHFNH